MYDKIIQPITGLILIEVFKTHINIKFGSEIKLELFYAFFNGLMEFF